MSQAFISYHASQRKLARKLAHRLAYEGYGVWWDRSERVRDQWSEAVTQALSFSQCVIVLWSKQSVRSAEVLGEATAGYARGALLCLTMDGTPVPSPFHLAPTIDVRDWQGDADDVAWLRIHEPLRAFLVPAERSAPRGQPLYPPITLAPVVYDELGALEATERARPLAAALIIGAVALGVAGYTFREQLPSPEEALERARETLTNATRPRLVSPEESGWSAPSL